MRSRIGIIFLVGLALIFVALAVQLFTPGEKIESTGPNGARITFSTDREMVIAPGGCVMVRWLVDHIKEVYLNDMPTVGQGFQTICLDGTTMPTLRLVFNDNTSSEYTLPVAFLIEQPTTWLLIGAGVLLALASLFSLLVRPLQRSPEEPGQVSRRGSRVVMLFAGIGLLLVGLTITALSLELGLRFYFGQYGTRDEKIAYLYSRAEIESLQVSTIPLPFIEYGLSPDFPGHNRLGYRGDDVRVPKPSGTFRIVVYGDSSTYGTTNPYDETYPYYLGEILRGERGYTNAEVVNAGVAGFTSWNSLVDLTLRGVELDPDLVIVYQGGNDVLPREVSPDCYSAISPFLGLDPRRQMRAVPSELSPSALYRLIAISLGWMNTPATNEVDRVNSTVGCTASGDAAQNVPLNPPIYFERNLHNMIGIARANDIPIMLATYAYNPNSEFALPYWRTAVAEHNAITTRVAEQEATLFLDYASIAPTAGEFWNDSIHMTSEGNLQMARTLADFLIKQGEIPPPTVD